MPTHSPRWTLEPQADGTTRLVRLVRPNGGDGEEATAPPERVEYTHAEREEASGAASTALLGARDALHAGQLDRALALARLAVKLLERAAVAGE